MATTSTPRSSGAGQPVNPLVALLANRASLGALAGSVLKLGARGLVFVARAYLGPLAYRTETTAMREASNSASSTGGNTTGHGPLTAGELAILALALAKLAYEIGELALYNPDVDASGRMPDFQLDEQGRAPALGLAHMIAAARWWDSYSSRQDTAYERARRTSSSSTPRQSSAALLTAARTQQYSQTSRYSYANTSTVSTGVAMTKTTSRGCGSCGGAARAATTAYTSASRATAPYVRSSSAVPSYATRLAGNASTAARMPATSNCGCGCGGGTSTSSNGCGCGCTPQTCGCGCGARPTTCGCGSGLPATRTYDSALCPAFAISCETKTALRDCVKVALCDFMRCIADTFCPGGRFDSDVFNDPNIYKELVDCVGQLACSFVHCVPDALCGPECSTTPTNDCQPCCDYAVEVQR